MRRPLLEALLLLLALLCTGRAAADAPFDVADLRGSAKLRQHVAVLPDETRALTLADVRTPQLARRFEQAPRSLTFGFRTRAEWLRLEVINSSERELQWLLEAAFPALDYVTLYIVRSDGRVEQRDTGDMLPFATRDVADPSFAFEIHSAPGERLTCYLRLQTSGSLRASLLAWERSAVFVEHYNRQNVVLWMFYGALFVMLLFNLGVYALIRQREYLVYSGLLVALWAVQFTLAGHTSQFLFPDQPVLANRLLPFAIGVVLVLIPLYAATSLGQFAELRAESRFAQRCVPVALGLLLFVSLAPLWLAIRGVLLAALLVALVSPYLLRKLRKKKNPQLSLYFASWHCLLLSVPLHALRNADLIPPFPLDEWIVQIGITVHGVFSSLALATRLKVARDELGTLNAQLSANVADLEQALATAHHASEEAQRATRVKDEFMATMSHELRTPLNAIINVPQGLLEDFPELPAVSCRCCGARFVLDAGETLEPDARCPDCQASASLQELTVTRYQGEPAHTARFLRKIERSGKHLLQMVNGVLDFSKMEAGRLTLSLAEVDLPALLGESVDEVSELARAKQLTLELKLDGTSHTALADALRLKQVLLNLLANAIKFSAAGGSVTVRWLSEADAELFSVSDQGIGIAPQDHGRIFNSFEQVHQGDTRRYGGTGLGLSISRSLVRMHGGELWVESRLGHGSTFWFRLPQRANVAAAGSLPSAQGADEGHRARTRSSAPLTGPH